MQNYKFIKKFLGFIDKVYRNYVFLILVFNNGEIKLSLYILIKYKLKLAFA